MVAVAPMYAWGTCAQPKLGGKQPVEPLRQQHLWSSVLRWPQLGQKVSPSDDSEHTSCGSSRRPSERSTHSEDDESATTKCGVSSVPAPCWLDGGYDGAVGQNHKSPADPLLESASTTCSALSSRVSSRASSRPSSAGSTQGVFDPAAAMSRLRKVAVGRQRGSRPSRFSRQALAQLWDTLDRESTGNVSQRDLVACLKENSDFREMMYLLATRPKGPTRELPGDDRHKMTREIKEIIREIDWNSASQLTWVGFVHTFEKHGMLAE
mmetsp:Transcript_126141/g.315275  ORF Transcript_126141/g.315275 Transcript_126141/m.315275 type:complete len:266 (+) Transcript_126141:103-900(+)